MNKMKLTLLPLTLALGMGFISSASASGYDCAAKRLDIENQIKYAQQHNNDHEVAGLQKALSELNMHCTDAGLVTKVEKKVAKLERKLREKQDDVREVQGDLAEAHARGNADKIAKYERKLGEKQADIAEITADLKQKRAELAALQG